MDPPHLTEFASRRYFDKLKHISETQDQPQDAVTHLRDGSTASLSSQFILPIGQSKSNDLQSTQEHQKAEKRRANFSFRTILPTRTSAEHDARRLSTESATKRGSKPFDQLFLALPNELKVEIIASLPLTDILSLRLASRSWHAMITVNESPITRYHLDHHVPAYATRLYPIPDPSSIKLHYLCGIWHRLHRLIPLLFTIFHFFEMYRKLHLEYIAEHGHGLSTEPYTLNPIEMKILNMYDDQTLLRVHEVFPLVISSFVRRLRPPSYVGRFEGALRGYLRDRPDDEVYVAALCVGGLRQVERFWEIKGYNTRRSAVDAWYHSVKHETPEHTMPPPPTQKPRRGFMGLSRKKSSMNMGDGNRMALDGSSSGRDRRGSETSRRGSDASTHSWRDFVFGTSLSEGMPMGPLSRDHLQTLLPDLPDLHSIWALTAEATILDRGIVGRPEDIKRNGTALLDLIRPDGAPLEAIEEDPIE
ncbi:F-box domain-containing protein [Xylariaceae sp. FL0255]|nr:F-box domain-containing protein [Xylariaceae sp. FL0255]